MELIGGILGILFVFGVVICKRPVKDATSQLLETIKRAAAWLSPLHMKRLLCPLMSPIFNVSSTHKLRGV